MKALTCAVATTVAAALTTIVPAGVAHAATPVEDCLAAHPGAVTTAEVTPGDDTVCMAPTDNMLPSEGDDMYLWVGSETEGTVTAPRDESGTLILADPGYDTLSLETWDSPWSDPVPQSMFGTRVFFEPDRVRLTPHDDNIGWTEGCGGLNGRLGPDFETIGGNDTVMCVLSNISTGDGDDTVVGVARNTVDPTGGEEPTVDTGTGNDTVTGDSDADAIVLGPGADTVDVEGGGSDEVWGGPGIDTNLTSATRTMTFAATAAAPERDVFHSVERGVPTVAPKPKPRPRRVVRPRAWSSVKCVRHATVRKVRLVNRRSNVAVPFKTVTRRPNGRLARQVVRVSAHRVKVATVRVKGKRKTAVVRVRAAGRLLHVARVPGRRCA